MTFFKTFSDRLLIEFPALQSHEARLFSHAQRLDAVIADQCNKSINVTKTFEYYTFDVMGDVHFGMDFGMLKSKKYDKAVNVLMGGMDLFGPFTPVPWLFHIARLIPGLQKDWFLYRAWSDQRLRSRLSRHNDIKSDDQDSVKSKDVSHSSIAIVKRRRLTEDRA